MEQRLRLASRTSNYAFWVTAILWPLLLLWSKPLSDIFLSACIGLSLFSSLCASYFPDAPVHLRKTKVRKVLWCGIACLCVSWSLQLWGAIFDWFGHL